MEILVAEHCGFCYGVKRAVKIAQDASKGYNNNVATLGELIHNPQVVADLKQIGVGCNENLTDFQDGSTIIIRSHGVGPSIYKGIVEKHLTLLDATCPHVLKAQKSAKALSDEGLYVIIIGEKEHPEVKSIKAWAGSNSSVVETKEDIALVPQQEKYGVVSQTTFEEAKFEMLLNELKTSKQGEYKVEKTICTATSDRQHDARELAKKCDAVLVIGGYKSANTRHLFDIVKAINNNAYHIESSQDVTEEMLKDVKTIGITAGASTPQKIIEEVIFNMETMESLLEQETVRLHIGMVVEATVVAVTKEEVIVDFGYQSEGSVAFDQWIPGGTRETVAPLVNVGDKVTLKVTASENRDGLVVMSKIKAEADQAWTKLPEYIENHPEIPVVGLKAVKGGLTVTLKDVAGVSGFIPASHLDLKKVDNVRTFEGKELTVNVLEFDPIKKRLVLSRRDILRQAGKQRHEEMEARKAEALAALKGIEPGTKFKGTVKNVVDFGIFVEIMPGVQGLVHVSELSWERGVKPADLYKNGDEVEVLVKDVDAENGRVSLSVKQLQEDPWQVAVKDIAEGSIVKGKVVRFLAFGAIVRLSEKLEGMVHVSEIAAERVEKPEDVLKENEEVTVKVIHIDGKHKKIGLSIIKAKEDHEKEEIQQFIDNKPNLSQDLGDKLNK